MVGVYAVGNLTTGGGGIQQSGAGGFDINLQRQINITGALTASVDNYNPTSFSLARILELTSNGAYTITGLVALGDARELMIFNNSAYTITLANEGLTSTAAYRMLMPGASNYSLAASTAVKLLYHPNVNRWVKLV
jgi:hypothetical protein